MSVPESPAITEVQQLIEQQKLLESKIALQTEALNLLGANIQWIIDNVKGIFEMFGNPQFMASLPSMMGGGAPDGGNREDGGTGNPNS